MDLFEELLADEEGHINYLESQLNLLNDIGAPELRPAQCPFRRRSARGGRLMLVALRSRRTATAAGSGRRAAPARRVPARLWRRRQRPHRLGPRMGDACLPHAAFVSPHAPEACGMAPMGRQWFNLTFRDPGELVRGVEQAAPSLDAFLDAELKRHNLPRARARARRLQPGDHDGARRRADAQARACRHRRLFRRAGEHRGAAASSRALRPRSCSCMATWTRSSRSMPCSSAREQLAQAGLAGRVARGARHRPRHRRPRACISAAPSSSRPSPPPLSSPKDRKCRRSRHGLRGRDRCSRARHSPAS